MGWYAGALWVGMSELCDSAHTEFCTEFTKQCRNSKILQSLFNSIALSSALMAATSSAKHFGVKVIKCFAVLCINAAVTGFSNFNKLYTFSNFGF